MVSWKVGFIFMKQIQYYITEKRMTAQKKDLKKRKKKKNGEQIIIFLPFIE